MPGLFYLTRCEIQYRLFQVERGTSEKQVIRYTAPLSGPAPGVLHKPLAHAFGALATTKGEEPIGFMDVYILNPTIRY